MTLKELQNELVLVEGKVSKVLKESGYWEDKDLCSVEYDRKDMDEVFLIHELNAAFDKLLGACRDMMYLRLPVRYRGKLHKQSNGRYCLGEYELTSGCGIEVLVYNDWSEEGRWIWTSIEHNGVDYYLVHQPDVCLEGLEARIRSSN